MTIKTTRYMDSVKVIKMCVKYGYCTKCDNVEYENLLEHCHAVATDNYVLCIAEQIMKYSDTESLMSEYGCNQIELLESICFNLINDCTYTAIELA